MKTHKYSETNAYYLEPVFMFIFLLTSLVSYFRGIVYMVSEREGRNIDNLENMGITKFTYFTASFTALVILQVILGIVITLGFRLFILNYCDVILFFTMYLVFSVTICSFGFLLQTFFLTTAKATITGIVFLIIIQIPYFMKMKIKQNGPDAIKFMTISPIFGIGNLITSILLADGSEM